VQGINAEQQFEESAGFKLISTGVIFFHSLPMDDLRKFIDFLRSATSNGFQK